MLSASWMRPSPGIQSSRTTGLTVRSSARLRTTRVGLAERREAPAAQTHHHPTAKNLLTRLTAITGSDSLRSSVAAAKGEEARRLAVTLGEGLPRCSATWTRPRSRRSRTPAPHWSPRSHATKIRSPSEPRSFSRNWIHLPGWPVSLSRYRTISAALPSLAAAGRTVEALAELEKLALGGSNTLAAAFDKWHTGSRRPWKLTAKQLALWQDDLLARLRVAAKAGGLNKLPDDAKTALRNEQKALHAAVETLLLPAGRRCESHSRQRRDPNRPRERVPRARRCRGGRRDETRR